MDAKTFLEEFETVAEAPGGIAKLRELILQLAVQGKLVPQDPNDEPASVLLERIATEKAQIVKEGKFKNQKRFPSISEEEILFELPLGWEWARLIQVTHDLGQKIPDAPFSYIDVSSIDKNQGLIQTKVNIIQPENAPSRARKLVSHDTVIYSTVRPYLLNIAIIDRIFNPEPIVSTAFAVLHPHNGVINRYLYYYLRSPGFVLYVEDQMKGVAYPAINDGNLLRGLIPLPPTAEQHRIVAKVDELMALCDQFEERQTQRNTTRKALQESALDALANAETPDELVTAWKRVRSHWDVITAQPDSIGTLRQTILQLAVQGKLVQQDPNDEPASMLLERIEIEKTELIKSGKIKKQKRLLLGTPNSENGTAFDIPGNWEWVRGDDVFSFVTSGSRGWAQYYSLEGATFLRIGNLDYETSELDLREIQHVAPPDGVEGQRTRTKSGDILVSITGDTGMIGLVPQDLGEAYINQHIALCRTWGQLLPKYLATSLRSHYIQVQLRGAERGVKNSLGLNDIKSLSLPLPPLAEQHRIVAKVDEMMAICDQLEERLQAQQETASELAGASVYALAG